jgi:hypothetical protein
MGTSKTLDERFVIAGILVVLLSSSSTKREALGGEPARERVGDEAGQAASGAIVEDGVATGDGPEISRGMHRGCLVLRSTHPPLSR